MLYEIKVLKAPWPKGAQVGDVVEMPSVPVWAQGKCAIAAEGAEATVEFTELVAGDGTGQPLPSVELINAELVQARGYLADAQESIQKQAEWIEGLQGELRGAAAQAAELRAKLEAAEAKAAELQTKLDAPVTDEAKAAAALLEAEAQAEAERKTAEGKPPAKGKSK